MMSYKPSMPFNVPAQIMKAKYETVNGIKTKTFMDWEMIWVSAKSYGGTWHDSEGVYVNIDGTWKEVEAVYVNVDGVWKSVE